MERKDGYIVLDNYKNVEHIVNESTGRNIYFFNIDNNSYVFKPTKYRYNELFAYVCSKELGLESIEYDLAIYKGFKGVISKNYKKEGAKYIKGREILHAFYYDNPEFLKLLGIENTLNSDFCDAINLQKINSLETIWIALEYYYDNIDVSNIMDKLVDLFIFSLLVNDFDKHSSNWEIEEYNNNISLVPIYDNERAFLECDEILNLHVSTDDFEKDPYRGSLEEFIKKSDRTYIDRLVNYYNIIYSEGKFDEIINSIEEYTHTLVPKDIKEQLDMMYYSIKSYVHSILEKYNLISNKKLN